MAHLTPNGNPSLKPRQGRSFKRARRIEIVARMEAQFIQDPEIAHVLGLTVAAIQAIKNSPEYAAKRAALSINILTSFERSLLRTEEDRKEELEEMHLLAMNGIKGILHDKNHPHFARVAVDLLDRNRATAKISRMEHSVAPLKSTQEQDARAKELMGLLEPDPTVNLPGYDPKKLPEFIPVPDETDGNPDDLVPKEELDKAIEENKDINDLVM